jgi:tetratricopeptide (TPR) repeat protein
VPLTLTCLGSLYARRGRYDDARRCYTGALDVQSPDDEWGRAYLLRELGLAALAQNDVARAAAHLGKSLLMHQKIGRKQLIAECLEGLALVARRVGEPRPATRLLASARNLRDGIAAKPALEDQQQLEQMRRALIAEVGQRQFDEDWQHGFRLPADRAVSEALAHSSVWSGGEELN